MSADQKTAVITGATSGIGRWIAAGLAKAGYGLTLIARDEARAAATVSWIRSRCGSRIFLLSPRPAPSLR
jgi:short-subunit dehydrogenase